MSLTRFSDDPCRIQKYLEETTSIGNYNIGVPGNGEELDYFNDPHIRMQKWGGNLSHNKTMIESDLRGITRKLNRDEKDLNNHVNYLNSNFYYHKKNCPIVEQEITHQPRTTNPAWTLRELNSITSNVPNNFYYLHLDPQENVCYTFNNNVSTRILEKDYFLFKENN